MRSRQLNIGLDLKYKQVELANPHCTVDVTIFNRITVQFIDTCGRRSTAPFDNSRYLLPDIKF